MKVIITGATGLVGSALVKQCIADERISSVILLARKEPPAEVLKNAKTTFISHQDFSQYPNELLEQMKGAQGCLWYVEHLIEVLFMVLG